MLDPNQRSLLSSLVTPPPGMLFDTGLATTYSLDPLTLLGVPVHLAWLASYGSGDVLTDPIRLLEALRRVTERFTVFADRGRMHVPGQANALFALLENTIVEVRAPQGGAFHPKIWLLRFSHPEGTEPVMLRLGILSRNLTFDRSWDLSLVLEGTLRGSYTKKYRPFGELIKALPSWAVRELSTARREQVEQLADEVRRVAWELPGAWEDLQFHVLGLRRSRLDPGPADEIAVISPFLTPEALAQLRQGKKRSVALVSRPETLAALPADARGAFERCLVLDDAAETEDGEEPETPHAIGLHAKAIVLRRGWYTHLFLGSANATSAAMVQGLNVEIMAELSGRRSQVGHIDDLLSTDGFGGLLADFSPQTPPTPEDAARADAELALETCQRTLASASLSVHCAPDGAGNWNLQLVPAAGVALGNVTARAWPLSLQPERGIDVVALATGAEVVLGVVDAADITGLIGFELCCGEQARRFALNLEVVGLPDDRDAAILRRIVRNREGFFRYLQLLLGGLGLNLAPGNEGIRNGTGSWQPGAPGTESLLEDLVRAWSREPARLKDVQRVVERLRNENDENGSIIPSDFDALWITFEQAMAN
ncbi:phospholipase D family protein [Methylotetracoccus oryzae]|uniref:phospholipase D family protein n=1 Tax=Methylotetracoccus oryzae TaxID=1919059 RepID=UPI00111AE619|nr:phospholipase D family protein [Methylotetracoccus oryzae]